MKPEDDFERSADLRLLELSRDAIGATRAAPSGWRHREMSRVDLLAEDEEPARPAGALLNVHFVARPAAGLIPGAQVTLAIAIDNDGDGAAENVSLRIGYDASLAPTSAGSRIDDDEMPEADVDALFGAGVDLGTIAPRERRTAIILVGIRPGVGPIVVEAVVRTGNAPVLAAPPLALERAGTAAAPVARITSPAIAAPSSAPTIQEDVPHADETETPFYELDAQEEIVYEAADAALSTAAPILKPTAELTPQAAESVAPILNDEPIALVTIEPIVTVSVEPIVAVSVEPVASVPAAEAVVTPLPSPAALLTAEAKPKSNARDQIPAKPLGADRKLVLVRRLDRARFDAVSAMFRSAGVGMLAHFLLANMLAAGNSPDESDPFGLARFLDEQTVVLNRLWVAKRLRKPMEVRENPVNVASIAPLPRERTGQSGALVASVGELERTFINNAVESGSITFLRARQITMMLQATGVVEDGLTVPVSSLVEYAKRAQNLMTKYALRAATKGPDEALATVDPVLDGYAKDVLMYLEKIVR